MGSIGYTIYYSALWHINYVASYTLTSGVYTVPSTGGLSWWEALDCEAGSCHGHQHLHHRGLQAVPPLCSEDLPEAYKIFPTYRQLCTGPGYQRSFRCRQ